MKPLLLSLALTFGADAATTHVGLATGRAHELILPSQNPYVADALIGGEMVGVAWLLTHLHRTNPKTAQWLGWGVVGSRGAAALYNMSQLAK